LGSEPQAARQHHQLVLLLRFGNSNSCSDLRQQLALSLYFSAAATFSGSCASASATRSLTLELQQPRHALSLWSSSGSTPASTLISPSPQFSFSLSFSHFRLSDSDTCSASARQSAASATFSNCAAASAAFTCACAAAASGSGINFSGDGIATPAGQLPASATRVKPTAQPSKLPQLPQRLEQQRHRAAPTAAATSASILRLWSSLQLSASATMQFQLWLGWQQQHHPAARPRVGTSRSCSHLSDVNLQRSLRHQHLPCSSSSACQQHSPRRKLGGMRSAPRQCLSLLQHAPRQQLDAMQQLLFNSSRSSSVIVSDSDDGTSETATTETGTS
jgi:hypothetical protein